MFHSKTEVIEGFDLDFNNEYEEHATISNINSTSSALAKALQNISELQENLSFMIDLNTQLRSENQKLKMSQEKTISFSNLQMTKKQRQIEMIKQENQLIADLLEEAKKSLLGTQQELEEYKEEILRKDRIIREQKKAHEELENHVMNQSTSYLNIGDTSSMCGKGDYQIITELQKENNQLQIALKRLQQQCEKLEFKNNKIQRQMADFKKWMASLVGMQKIVEGSQKIVMKEIGQRVLST